MQIQELNNYWIVVDSDGEPMLLSIHPDKETSIFKAGLGNWSLLEKQGYTCIQVNIICKPV